MTTTLTVPAAQLGDANDQAPAAAWWQWGSSMNWGGRPGQPGLPITARDWSWPIWQARDAAGRTIRVWRNPAVWDEPARWSTVAEFVRDTGPAVIPWGAGWRGGTGTDQGVLVDDGIGGGWDALNLRPANWLDAIPLAFRSRFQARSGDWVCDGLVRRTPTNDGTYEGRGAGRVPKRAGILTADMAANGVTTALAMVGFNVQYEKGARFVAPATRVEHLTAASLGPTARTLPPGNDPRMIPHGTRFRLSMTDLELDQWSTRHAGAKRTTALIVATGLRDYGWVCLETGTGRCQLESEGTLNPAVAAVWSSIGMRTDADFGNLLDGLFTPSNVKVVNAK